MTIYANGLKKHVHGVYKRRTAILRAGVVYFLDGGRHYEAAYIDRPTPGRVRFYVETGSHCAMDVIGCSAATQNRYGCSGQVKI